MSAQVIDQLYSIEFDQFNLELESGQLLKSGEPVKLRPKNAAVLCLLASQPRTLISTDEIMSKVWGDVVVGPVTLNQTILEIRRALGDHARSPQFVETVPKRGFRFIADCKPVWTRSDPSSDLAGPSSLFQRDAGQTPCVGREEELAELLRLYELASTGSRQIAFVSGQAGIGKTRLIHQFMDDIAAQPRFRPYRAGVGHCVNLLGESEAFAPILTMLADFGREDPDLVAQALQRVAPHWIGQIPELSVSGAPATADNTDVSPGTMLRQIVQVFEDLAREIPLVVCIEDIHWGDRATVDFISALASGSRRSKLLLIASFRTAQLDDSRHHAPGLITSLLQRQLCIDIQLKAITLGDTVDYVTRIFQLQEGTQELAQAIYQHSAGIPIFMRTLIDEFIREASSDGDSELVDVATATKWITDSGTDRISSYIESMLITRDETELRVLEAASVAGSVFSAATVAAALQESVPVIELACDHLASCGFLITRQAEVVWPDHTASQQYTYEHDLLREALYRRTSGGRRQLYHARIAARIEQGYGDKTKDVAAALARHFESGGKPSLAIPYIVEAGSSALSRGAPSNAVEMFDHALKLLESESSGAGEQEQEIAIRLQLHTAQTLVDGYGSERLGTNLKILLDIPAVSEDAARQAGILCAQGRMQHARADYENGVNTFSRVLDLELPRQAMKLHIFAHGSRAMMAVWSGKLSLAEEEITRAAQLESAPKNLSVDALATEVHLSGLCAQAYASWLRGFPDRARKTVDRFDILAAGLTRIRALSASFAAQLFALMGDRDYAEIFDQKAGRHRTEFDLMPSTGVELAPSGWILGQRGDLGAAVTRLEEGLATTRESGDVVLRSIHLATLAEVHVTRGDVAAGQLVIDRALNFVESTGERIYEAEIHRLNGELHSLAGDTTRARDEFDRALNLARKQGALSLELKAATSLARLLKNDGQLARAYKLLSPIYDRLTEGFDTRDLRAAHELLGTLSD